MDTDHVGEPSEDFCVPPFVNELQEIAEKADLTEQQTLRVAAFIMEQTAAGTSDPIDHITSVDAVE
jgi:hypothetical protein